MERLDWNDRYRTTELVWTADANRFVVREAADLEPGRMIDLAAGEGRNAIWFAERGWEATAVDFSDVAMAKAAGLAQQRGVELETVVADVTTFQAEPESYDLALIAYLQVPEAGRRAALERAVNALAPGGELLVVGHDRSNVGRGWGGPSDPAVQATPDELRAMAESFGLTVDKAEVVERPVDTPDGARIAYDHVLVAHRPARADQGQST